MSLIKLSLAMLLFVAFVNAQDSLPVIKSNSQNVSIQEGDQFNKNGWRLSPETKPDVYEAYLLNGKPAKVTFITDVDRISFNVEEGKKYDFIIQWGDEICYTQIVGKRYVPAASFDKKYQAAHKGIIFIEIPEVYELVNVAIAITPTGIKDRNLVYQNSEYYKRVRQWFDKYQNHPLIAALDAAFKRSPALYFNLKMNGYSFEFDKNNKIVQSKVYDRTAFRGERSNSLRPFLEQLQSFSDQTNFRQFYKENKKTYDEQTAFYRDEINIAEMKRWLDKNFPTSNNYDAYKIIFSPLVGGNQSTTWIESNGFKELHPHVNFPYEEEIRRYAQFEMSKQTANVFRGDIVFTEINHGYINPEADKYGDRILKATSNREYWVDKRMPANYYPGTDAFNEYMNWALVSLRFVDYVPREEQDKAIAVIDRMMTKSRSFPQFELFDKFLVDLYRNRKPDQTIADLYPQIIEWFERKNEESTQKLSAMK